ncbi:sugar ABC transporter substrate-binding protein [Microbulbifer sp. S227A]|uniref:sugar ABC transporter substrate-binding protein n=1 Tax=Microbulbifer sp. S227A TaxID=3415131 RepID=UPI003C7ED3F0
MPDTKPNSISSILHFAAHLALAASLAGGAHAAENAAEKVIAFDETGAPFATTRRFAYLTECVQNAYCQQRLRGMEDAAARFNFEFQTFDANFNPAEQLKQVQNAAVGDFDAYILGPTAAAQSCNMWKQFLVPTGKPVVTVDLPMCGDTDHTAGLAGTVTMQRQAYFDAHVENAFASCSEPCEVAAVGGFVGSDLYNLWTRAIENGVAKYPNARVVVEQAGNFDPGTALRVIQDGLLAHPDISVVISSWDDMTRGVVQAVSSAGKTPGEDVRIYSVGGTSDGISRVRSGSYSGTTILLPYEESYYGAVAAVMAVQGEAPNGYIDEARLPAVTGGPGTIFIDAGNADSFTPRF